MTALQEPVQWTALRPGDDAGQRARAVAAARESFLNLGDPHGVRSVVLDSWRRSRANGIQPAVLREAPALTADELRDYRARNPMSSITPVIHSLLTPTAVDCGCLVAVTDAHGRLLWVDGDPAVRTRAMGINFVEGVDWSERAVGTNAPGTALAVDHWVQIYGAEHFADAAHSWSCAAVPVHDPLSGRTIGAVDLTGGPRVAEPEVLALVRATVAAAEAQLRVHALTVPAPRPGSRRLAFLGSSAHLRDSTGRTALSRRHAEILLLLAEHREGLHSEELAVLLDEGELDAVTIRAEVSRLRRVLGAEAIASRPYRLTTEFVTDVGELRAALDRGDAATALSLYAGALLPQSLAPGVVEVREELRTRTRAAVMRSGDPRLLERWTRTPHGRDDYSAWLAYRRLLSPDSSAFAQVSAQISTLDRRLRP